ncbi:hypothetical protein [Streptomyces sp. A1547]|uniref:hypothetical protein n=1 Tax=Streptomyces sp. A1547 TaxID=2563105 RepID=UPI001F11477F|nr:hypothetical protein [Streptomyces sp. A1547]
MPVEFLLKRQPARQHTRARHRPESCASLRTGSVRMAYEDHDRDVIEYAARR